jgi:hypothetical protein
MLLLTLFRRRGLRAIRQKPSHCSGGRDITAVPRPGVSGSPLRIAVKKSPHLVRAAKKRFLGRDHDDVGIWREQPHDAVGIPRREPGAEALEDLEQRGLRLRIRPHGQGILALRRAARLESDELACASHSFSPSLRARRSPAPPRGFRSAGVTFEAFRISARVTRKPDACGKGPPPGGGAPPRFDASPARPA